MWGKEAVNKLAFRVESKLILKDNQCNFSGFILKKGDLNGLFRQFEAILFSETILVRKWFRITGDNLVLSAYNQVRIDKISSDDSRGELKFGNLFSIIWIDFRNEGYLSLTIDWNNDKIVLVRPVREEDYWSAVDDSFLNDSVTVTIQNIQTVQFSP
jgi:hypothetical protein